VLPVPSVQDECLGEERDALDEHRAVVSEWGQDGRLRLEDGLVFVESLSARAQSLSPFQEDLSAFEADRSVLREDVVDIVAAADQPFGNSLVFGPSHERDRIADGVMGS
jgi:hypothetical protein